MRDNQLSNIINSYLDENQFILNIKIQEDE